MNKSSLMNIGQPNPGRIASAFAAAAFLLAGLFSIALAYVSVSRYEAVTLEHLSKVTRASGHTWAKLVPDGRLVRISGIASGKADGDDLIRILGSMIDPERIVDETAPPAEPEPPVPAHVLQILRNGSEVIVSGVMPGQAERAAVLREIAARVHSARITDLLETGAGPATDGWSAALSFGLDSLSRLRQSSMVIRPEAVSVVAVVGTPEGRNGIETALTAARPENVALRLEVRAPRPRLDPFLFRAAALGGTIDVTDCSAESAEDARRILDAALAAGSADFQCGIGLGAPHPDWASVVAAGIAAISELRSATVRIVDTDVRLVGHASNDRDVFDGASRRLRRSLPERFSLHAVPPPESVTDASTGTREATGFRATLSPEGLVQLDGFIPDGRIRDTVAVYAQALFGSESVHDRSEVGGDLPAGWPAAIFAGLDSLALLRNGALSIQADLIAVRGIGRTSDSPALISQLLSAEAGGWSDSEVDVEYFEFLAERPSEEKPAEPVELDPVICGARISATLEDQQIAFAPASANIDSDSEKVIDAIAEILADCPSARFEIEGHTDSQGREEMNKNLSQSRAEAVVGALIRRRVLTSGLTAVGYGEERPVADNSSEAGRSKNRRIEFRLLSGSGEQSDEQL